MRDGGGWIPGIEQVCEEAHLLDTLLFLYYNNALRRKSKGVAKNSYHMRGLATDITISGVSPKEIYDYVNSFHQGGLGLYPTFVHVDVRDTVGDPKSRW